jgi:hypothetical protein
VSDLRELTRGLLDQPLVVVPPLEMVRRRADRLRRRRRAMAATPALLAVVVATLVVVQADTSRPSRVRTVDPAPADAGEPIAPAGGEQPSGHGADGDVQPTTPRHDTASSVPNRTSPLALPPAASNPYGDAPSSGAEAASGCELVGSWYASRSDPSQYPRCTFIADQELGFVGRGEWWMTVRRPDGSSRGYCYRDARPDRDTDYSATCGPWDPRESNPHPHLFPVPHSCGAVGFIQPGDEVSVWLHDGGHRTHAADHGDPPAFKAGREHHC